MTIDNKKSTARRYDKNRHYSAVDQIRVGAEIVCGQIDQDGPFYVLRLRSNPHHAEWVTFKND
jgi:hypothetical protein